jgi:phosphoribosylglycinamide formyltransferase-1
MTHTLFPIAILISGSGTTLRNLIKLRDAGSLDVDIRLVISSNPDAGGIEFAKNAGIPVIVKKRSEYTNTEAYSVAIFDACQTAKVELVVMGGFLKHVLIPSSFENRVLNIHPSLIPKYCGKGYYGKKVHQAVIDAGESESGCTVHFVDDHYDHGPILAQKAVDVLVDDTAESLAARVFQEECKLLPDVIRRIANGELARNQ